MFLIRPGQSDDLPEIAAIQAASPEAAAWRPESYLECIGSAAGLAGGAVEVASGIQITAGKTGGATLSTGSASPLCAAQNPRGSI